ncbi:methyl-accepting chemotaxis protein [Fulvimarina endophytica]|uniref:methyl-accepting chemotaxis protein n=1 Tax=Fulvimarina endophytica TaxID=2293836 RepID=UPI001FE23935|nr:methyl-accepting chemotaxis protein [Fulvimarina endophytica]
MLDALSRTLTIVEFDPKGRIVAANANFCKLTGYAEEELLGRHHRMLVTEEDGRSADYQTFWERLAKGEAMTGEFRRVGRDGRELWLKASYNPIVNAFGTVVRVVKEATDMTGWRDKVAEVDAKLDAISATQAIIEFTPSGEVLTANRNFLDVMGYGLDEIRGRHHRMFVEPQFAQSADYASFWARLNRGEYLSDEYKRIGKGGREIWLFAFYNPIRGADGRVLKIVKFATDVTPRVNVLQAVGTGLHELSRANLDCRIDQHFPAVFEALRTDFNSSLNAITRRLSEVVGDVAAIRETSREIVEANGDLSRRTETQARNLERTSASLDEITATVRGAAGNASSASEVMRTARLDAENSGNIVGRAVVAMKSIETSSREIGQIIGLIDEIAFQTSLLALNAGVEAARAGEAGRGFAVVASEVRSLAQRSADAAKQIKTLVSVSGQEVENGVRLVDETGQALMRIVQHVAEVSGIVARMSGSSSEQALALGEINTAVKEMDQLTQHNAALVEQTAARSAVLADLAVSLDSTVGEFRLPADRTPGGSVVPLRQAASIRSSSDVLATSASPARTGSAARKAQPMIEAENWEDF